MCVNEDKILRMKDLIKALTEADIAYYRDDDPVMSDREYDQLTDELLKLEAETGLDRNAALADMRYSFIEGVVEVLEELTSVRHTKPMLSAKKTKSIEELVRFAGGRSVLVSWKLDGLTIVLRYENGEPIYATLDSYYVKKDDVIRLYYVACPTADGHHIWNDGEVTKAAACTEDGEMTYTCTMCGDQKTEIIPATGHDWGQPVWSWNGVESAAATFICTNDSSHVEVENAVITNEITTPATCTTDGVRTYTAAVTFEQKTYTAVKTEVIPATGHDTQVVGAKPATCTEDGYTGDEVCKTCGETVKKGETIPATGHDYKDGKCTVCGAADPDYRPEQPEDPGQPEKPEQPENPGVKTGDSGVLLYMGLMTVCALGACLTLRRRKAR